MQIVEQSQRSSFQSLGPGSSCVPADQAPAYDDQRRVQKQDADCQYFRQDDDGPGDQYCRIAD